MFYALFAASGLDVAVEDSTSRGRVDLTVRLDGRVYLFKFKVVDSAPEDAPARPTAALAQLRERGYADKAPRRGPSGAPDRRRVQQADPQRGGVRSGAGVNLDPRRRP